LSSIPCGQGAFGGSDSRIEGVKGGKKVKRKKGGTGKKSGGVECKTPGLEGKKSRSILRENLPSLLPLPSKRGQAGEREKDS